MSVDESLIYNLSKTRLRFPGHVSGAVALEDDALDGRLEEVADGVGADGGEEAQQNHVLVQPRVHAELLDAAHRQEASSS